MPARNVVKPHISNTWYHLYNRGSNKQEIFLEAQDYFYFIKLFKNYLSPDTKTDPKTGLINVKNISSEVTLSCFCLMPNHFHLLVKQRTADGITKLMQRLITKYVLFFNRKYLKSGQLFEGKLKGVIVDNEAYLLHLSRYIHRNPINMIKGPLISYEYSSYPYFMGKKHATWLSIDPIINFFYSPLNFHKLAKNNYREFVEYENNESDNQINKLTLDD